MSDVVGLIPAAGRATRLGLGASSKELVAVPDLAARERPRPSVPVCHYLLRQYRAAGIEDVRLLRRAEKTDLAAHFGAGPVEGLSVRDTVVAPTAGSVHTLALGCRAAPKARIAVGFPDIVLTPATLCRAALDELERGAADICIGSVDIDAAERRNWDLLRTDGARVIGYTMKPERGSALERGTALAVWRPSATAFLLAWLGDRSGAGAVVGEVSLGHFLQAAIAAGLAVHHAHAGGATVLDIGVPERLARAARLGR